MKPAGSMERLPSLDGWRALSVLIVLGSHTKHVAGYPAVYDPVFNWIFDGGGMGVRFFFIISGFLITYLLLEEQRKNGFIDLKNFYLRRALRILPVYFCYLSIVFAFQIFTPWRQSPAEWVENLTFTTDFFGHPWPTSHLWTLGVEEQFYLFWPILLIWIGFRNQGRSVFYILGPIILIAPICRVLTYTYFSPPFFKPLFYGQSILNYMDSLAIGCLTAIIFIRKRFEVAKTLEKHAFLCPILGCFLILTPYVLRHYFLAGIFTVPFSDSCGAIGFSLLLVQSIMFPDRFRILNWPVVQTVGILSYSMYIWQQVFCTDPKAFGWRPFWFLSFPGWLLAVLLVSMISYYCLEKPLLGLRGYFRGEKPLRSVPELPTLSARKGN